MDCAVYIDGGARGNPGPAAAGVAIDDDAGQPLFEGGFFLGRMTNNAAEYHGLLRALDVLRAWPDAAVTFYCDSELLVRQITGEYRVRNADLAVLHERAQVQLLRRDRWCIRHVPREKNQRADRLANQAMDAEADIVVVDLRAKGDRPARGNGSDATTGRGKRRRADPPCPPLKKGGKEKASAPDAEELNGAAGVASATGAVDGANAERAADTVNAAGTASAASAASSAGAARGTLLRCTSAPSSGVCPAACRTGQAWRFGSISPAGLCLDALAAALNTVLALRDAPIDPRNPTPPLTLRCFRLGCGAVFELSS